MEIRKGDSTFYKTFQTEEDAKLYEFYKERLLNNLENFEVDISNRLTLENIIEMKIKHDGQSLHPKNVVDMKYSFKRIIDFLPTNKKFYVQYTFEDWVESLKHLQSQPVYRGAKTELGKRVISLKTIRKVFAHLSSAISFCQTQGIKLDNLPLKILQVHVNKLINNKKNEDKED